MMIRGQSSNIISIFNIVCIITKIRPICLFSEDVRRLQERAPELMESSLKFEEQTLDQTSDIWSLGCTILQFLLDTDTWNIVNFMKQFGVIDEYLALQKVSFMMLQIDDQISFQMFL